jgi:hypothetical protein
MPETSGTTKQEIKLFYCYAHEDEALRDELHVNLAGLRRQYRLTSWHDRKIMPGEQWEEAIDKHLSTADVILLLISPHFVDSDYCYGKEMQRALERHHADRCRVIPILCVRPIGKTPLSVPFRCSLPMPNPSQAGLTAMKPSTMSPEASGRPSKPSSPFVLARPKRIG